MRWARTAVLHGVVLLRQVGVARQERRLHDTSACSVSMHWPMCTVMQGSRWALGEQCCRQVHACDQPFIP